MLTMDFKARLLNKSWWISVIAAIILIAQQCGFNITQYIPSNYAEIINSIFGLLILVGITVDTSTNGISDQVVSKTTVQAINVEQTKEEVTTEATTTAINNTVTQNSASSKITVDNPENVQEIGATVTATSAVAPQ